MTYTLIGYSNAVSQSTSWPCRYCHGYSQYLHPNDIRDHSEITTERMDYLQTKSQAQWLSDMQNNSNGNDNVDN